MRGVLWTYVLAQVPGWGLGGCVLWGLQHWDVLSPRFALGLFAVWVAKDVLLFPVLRRFYEPDPAAGRMVGELGIVVTALVPEGMVRVRGELWKARSDRDLPPGTSIRVRDRNGLTLFVEAATSNEP